MYGTKAHLKRSVYPFVNEVVISVRKAPVHLVKNRNWDVVL